MKHLIHRDQVHKDVYYDPLSIALLNTPQMQRLGRIYQLGFTHLVYRGGTHTRLSHVMGASAVAEKLVLALKKNYEIADSEECIPKGAVMPVDFLPKINNLKGVLASTEERWEVLTYLVKWGALLHDIGHIPLGHTLEDEFSGIYLKHDSFESERMAYLWNEEALGKNSPIKEVLLNRKLYPSVFQNLNFKPSDIWQVVMLICLYKDKQIGESKENQQGFINIYNDSLEKHHNILFHQYMADIVADTICADYIDYLQRDTLNVGLDPVKEDRIIHSYFIGIDMVTKRYRMALSLKDKGGKPKLSICTAAKNMVRHRFDLAEIIYYHKTKVAASAMLAKVFALIDKPKEVAEPRLRIKIDDIDIQVKNLLGDGNAVEMKKQYMPESLLDPCIGDEVLLLWLMDKAWEKIKIAKERKDEQKLRNALLSVSLLEGIIERRLYKVAISINADVIGKLLGTDQKKAAVERVIEGMINEYRKSEVSPNNRDRIETSMSEKAGFPHGTFISYVPGRKVQAKGIETGALDETGEVITLGEHSTVIEEVTSLNESYKNLWRFLVYVHPKYKNNNIELSDAVDRLLQTLFPSIDLRRSSDAIKQACWFPYIPIHNRLAAKEYVHLNTNDPDKINWLQFNNAKRTSSGTIDSKEHAYRAKLMDRVPLGKINENFAEPGSLAMEIEREIEPIAESESKKGIAEVESIITAIERISNRINKADNSLQNKLFK
jgi:HD superfamily phosphohydrolase